VFLKIKQKIFQEVFAQAESPYLAKGTHSLAKGTHAIKG
jgi:hypothetical protein